jgi:hypothetical protein
MKISTETLRTWDGIRQYARPGWIFRGQRSEAWTLKTSLERCFDRNEIPLERRRDVELDLLREFRRAYHQYARRVPKPSDAIEWLSLMQHHGAPTRLLDFTYSVYVASYFAVEAAEREESAAVWAIDGVWAIEESQRRFAAARRDAAAVRLLGDRFDEDSEAIVSQLFLQSPAVPLACPLNPFRLSERWRVQKGVFFAAGDPSKRFEDNFAALAGHDEPNRAVKIVLPPAVIKEALPSLFQMNISRATLFPGLDGYAQGLGAFHPSFKLGFMLWHATEAMPPV